MSPQTRYILVRFQQADPLGITNLATGFINVSGAASGPHPGKTKLASDGRTVIFEMGADFEYNELVTVNLNPAVPGTNGPVPFQYEFMVAAPFPGSSPLIALPRLGQMPPEADEAANTTQKSVPSPLTKLPAGRKAARYANGVSVPSDFPQVSISVNSNPSPGYLFLENALGVPPYTMMLDNNGLPVWYRKGRLSDFKIQKNGLITWCVSDGSAFQAFDQNFNYVQTYTTTNGYLTDGHDFKVLPDGRYFMIGYRTNTVDMSHYVADDNVIATVTETVVQEFSAVGELIFQWRAWDNYNLGDEGGNSDFPHLNGIDIDEDGNLLISARHLSEVTKVDLNSGDVIWRLGGAHNNFTFLNDPLNGFSYQHNISALGNGHYLVFDNGNMRLPRVSRAAEYVLDPDVKTASLVWQFRDSPDKYAFWMGSAQRLPTGNTLIDFVIGGYPKATEVDPSGNKRFELNLNPSSDSYRAYRFPWNGTVTEPYLVSEAQGASVTLIFNKFGDHNVTGYRIYGATYPHPTNLVAVSSSTLLTISNLNNGVHYFRVAAVSGTGTESPLSNEESVTINVARPGQNIVLNSGFAQGTNDWSFYTASPASASWTVADGVGHASISSGGSSLSGIQLVQSGISLTHGRKYVLSFDAWSSVPRYLNVGLIQALWPYTNYTRFLANFVTPNRTDFVCTFTMDATSDPASNLVFYLGGGSGDVFLTNIKLFNPAPADLNTDGGVDWLDFKAFSDAWLKQGSAPDFDGNGVVNFQDLGVLGNSWGSGG